MKAFPIGVDNFESLILEEEHGDRYYYVDKTPLIREVVSTGGQVHLIPSPRRFGKSLNLDMIRQFVDIKADKSLFEGLKISEDRAFCEEYQGQFPVLYFNMKDIRGLTFEEACNDISAEIVDIMGRYYHFLMDSPKLSEQNRSRCALYGNPFAWEDAYGRPTKSLSVSDLKSSLERLSHYLEKHYGRKVVVLIDEYDVPLRSAWLNDKNDPGYYDKMVDLIEGMLSPLLKSNDSLAFGVITGCMRISLARLNWIVWGRDKQFNQEYFGFTDSEVKAMLDYYGIPEFYDTIKEWYGGFNFGGEDLYCPSDILQYVNNCTSPRSSKVPQLFWANSSGNDILANLLQRSTPGIQERFAELVNGDTIEALIRHELTFRDLDRVSSIWSLLVATGYLTVVSERGCGDAIVRAPNREVRKILGRLQKRWVPKASTPRSVPL